MLACLSTFVSLWQQPKKLGLATRILDISTHFQAGYSSYTGLCVQPLWTGATFRVSSPHNTNLNNDLNPGPGENATLHEETGMVPPKRLLRQFHVMETPRSHALIAEPGSPIGSIGQFFDAHPYAVLTVLPSVRRQANRLVHGRREPRL